MVYNALKEELKGHNAVIGSVKPGVVLTPLLVTSPSTPFALSLTTTTTLAQQSAVSSPEVDPGVVSMVKENKCLTPEYSAKFMVWLLTELPEKEFTEVEWSIYDGDHSKHWDK